jgi:hypothetical protein
VSFVDSGRCRCRCHSDKSVMHMVACCCSHRYVRRRDCPFCNPAPIEKGTADCLSNEPHLPHDWEYEQIWGGTKTFKYRCRGIKKVIFERYDEDEE